MSRIKVLKDPEGEWKACDSRFPCQPLVLQRPQDLIETSLDCMKIPWWGEQMSCALNIMGIQRSIERHEYHLVLAKEKLTPNQGFNEETARQE